MSTVSKNPLIVDIAEGRGSADALRMLVNRQLPLTDEEYLEGLALAIWKKTLAERADVAFKKIPKFVREAYVQKKDANHQVVKVILADALVNADVNVINHIIHNSRLPADFLSRIGEKAPAASLEVLVDNQIRLIAYPEILDSIERNPQAGGFVRGKIKEIRDFYLNPEAATPIPEQEVIEELTDLVASQEGAGDADPGEIKQKTLTTLQRINRMTVPERIKLALIGTQTERMVLIRDYNKIVNLAVLESPKITDDEVLALSKNKSLSSDIIGRIASDREWTKNYQIVLSLMQNPKVPVSKALGFLKKLYERDLRLLAMDRNINPVIRTLAFNLLKEKQKLQ